MAARKHGNSAMKLARGIIVSCLAVGGALTLAGADTQPGPKERLRPAGIDGSLLLCARSVPESVVQRFLEAAGGEKARLVVLSAAGEDDKAPNERLKAWQERKPASVVLLQADSRKAAEVASFAEPLRQASAVWIEGPEARLKELYRDTAVQKELAALLLRGGIIAGRPGVLSAGLPLLPDNVVATVGAVRNLKPGLVGLALDDQAALLMHGRDLRALGEGNVRTHLAAAPGKPPRVRVLKPGTRADLTQLRRAALARTEPPFPPKEPAVPEVAKGALVIVGGGGLPAQVIRKFIDLAGGPNALIVVLPTANPDPVPATAEGSFLVRAGAKNVKVLPGRDLKDVEDPQNLELLRKATGVWFGGGRQWRFVDAYEGTKALDLFRDVLRRGGVIGGSSAGATIQGDYLCRGSPLNNTDMMCEGYERGFGFLPGVAIDQHFAQRKRFGDMTALKNTYPQLLGIGLDEGTALVVRGGTAEVVGRGQAHFYGGNGPAADGKPDYESVKAGDKYDLKARKVLSKSN